MAAGLAFLVAVAWWPGLISSATLPRQAVVAVGVPLLMRVDPRDLDRRILWLLIFGVAWALGACQTMEAGFWLLVLAVAFVAGAGFKSLDGVMTGFAIGLGINSAICVAQLLGWQGIKQHTVPAGLFFSREVLAELAAPVAVWWWIQTVWEWGPSRPKTWGYDAIPGALAVSATIPLILCGERTAILAAVVGVGYYVRCIVACGRRERLHNRRIGRVLGWKVAHAAAEFSAEATFILILGGLMLILFGPERWLTALDRIAIWQGSASLITTLGHGLGWFKMTYPHIDVAHSDVIQMFVELGIGAIFFLAIPVICFAEKRGSDAERACLLAICVIGTFSFLLEMPANGFLAAVVTGYLGARRRDVCRAASDGAGDGCPAVRWCPDGAI